MKESFKHYLEKMYIDESPMRLGNILGDYNLQDFYQPTKNVVLFRKLLKNKQVQFVQNFGDFEIYIGQYRNNVRYYITVNQPTNKMILGYVQGQITDNNFFEHLIWQWEQSRGLIRNFYLNFLVNQYDQIISDEYHTDLGENFWIKTCQEAFKNNIKVFLLDKRENVYYPIKDWTMVKKTFGNRDEFENFQLVLRK